MKLNISNLNPGIWFDIPNTDAKVCLRVCSPEIIEEIDLKTNKKIVEYKSNQRFEIEKIDRKLRNEMIWDYVIVDWKNINDNDDKPIECTKKNKIMLIRKMPKFVEFISNCLDKINLFNIEQEDKEEKN
jgi:hypothetical protein